MTTGMRPQQTEHSVNDISGLSPHNILLFYIYYVKVVLRNRCFLWRCPLSRGPFAAASRMVSQSPSGFASPFVSANQSLEGPYHGLPVVGLSDSAGHYSRNGILPTSLPSFSTSVPDRPGGLYETRMSCRCTKKTACVVRCWHNRSRRLNFIYLIGSDVFQNVFPLCHQTPQKYNRIICATKSRSLSLTR